MRTRVLHHIVKYYLLRVANRRMRSLVVAMRGELSGTGTFLARDNLCAAAVPLFAALASLLSAPLAAACKQLETRISFQAISNRAASATSDSKHETTSCKCSLVIFLQKPMKQTGWSSTTSTLCKSRFHRDGASNPIVEW